MSAFYNEIDSYCAEWMVNLERAGHIAPGTVDLRDIRELRPADVSRIDQCHFFAGLGGWSHALRLAGWPDDVPVWTGSCPCQPFSAAGRRRGTADERHLWPAWFDLIRECRPAIIFGEQVSSPDALAWFDAVSADLEGAGYAVGALDTCAAGVGAPHLRQRLYFVAIACDERCERLRVQLRERRPQQAVLEAFGSSAARGVGDSERSGLAGWTSERGDHGEERAPAERAGGPTRGFWAHAEWIECSDGKARAVEPGTFPLAHGVPGRVGRLRAYGNAICAPLAAEFIGSTIDWLCETVWP